MFLLHLILWCVELQEHERLIVLDYFLISSEVSQERVRYDLLSMAGKRVSFDCIIRGCVWDAHYCPTSYMEEIESFQSYSFDTIPVPVLKHWHDLKQQYPFDHFEIWTTKERGRRGVDPLLIGVFERSFYLLARWGKEAKDLLDFSEVCNRVYERHHDYFSLHELPTKVADTIRRLQFQNLGRIIRQKERESGLFFPTKHCGANSLVFSLRYIAISVFAHRVVKRKKSNHFV